MSLYNIYRYFLGEGIFFWFFVAMVAFGLFAFFAGIVIKRKSVVLLGFLFTLTITFIPYALFDELFSLNSLREKYESGVLSRDALSVYLPYAIMLDEEEQNKALKLEKDAKLLEETLLKTKESRNEDFNRLVESYKSK